MIDDCDQAGVVLGDTEPTGSWDSIRAWRSAQRTRLLAYRENLNGRDRSQAGTQIIEILRHQGLVPDDARLGFYWPRNGEADLRPFIRAVMETGVQAALPVIISQHEALEFWKWDTNTKLCSRGLWNIPAPADRNLIQPTILFVPLLGFDKQGYRLGHGGGYYDRTLADIVPRPLAIGIGHEFGRLPTIYPQAHDMPMDAIVTEAGINWYPAPQV